VATKEYHTSSFTPVEEHVGAGAVEGVADIVVPVVVAAQSRSGFTVNPTAPAQLSLAGGGGGIETQISNVPLLLFPNSQNRTQIKLPGVSPVLVILGIKPLALPSSSQASNTRLLQSPV
jgi:hypothetical protein